MAERPHLAYPVELKGGRLLAVEQDSDREVADCIAVICSWPQGTRQGLPEFGVPGELFDSGGPDLVTLRGAVSANEPRAIGVRDELLIAAFKGGVANVRLGFDTTGSETE